LIAGEAHMDIGKVMKDYQQADFTLNGDASVVGE
jgi:hypothetical protein